MKTIRHKWVKQPGFRIHKCSICGLIRLWSPAWKSLMYRKYERGDLTFFKLSCNIPNTKN
jgi:hypothetical protein